MAFLIISSAILEVVGSIVPIHPLNSPVDLLCKETKVPALFF
nr:hypothetical protein [Dictyoglomus thermophilum]